jgi:hypothetical protein
MASLEFFSTLKDADYANADLYNVKSLKSGQRVDTLVNRKRIIRDLIPWRGAICYHLS